MLLETGGYQGPLTGLGRGVFYWNGTSSPVLPVGECDIWKIFIVQPVKIVNPTTLHIKCSLSGHYLVNKYLYNQQDGTVSALWGDSSNYDMHDVVTTDNFTLSNIYDVPWWVNVNPALGLELMLVEVSKCAVDGSGAFAGGTGETFSILEFSMGASGSVPGFWTELVGSTEVP